MASRIVVKGASGSGKSTLAAHLAWSLGLPHIELDALHHGPNWSELPLEEFRRRVEEATTATGWIVDGNYDLKLGDLVLRRADLVVWLDPPLHVIVRRLWRRTASRIGNGAELWAGNRENWRSVLWGRDSLFVWAIRTHCRLRRKLPARCRRLGVDLVRLGTAPEMSEWLEDARERP
jgi:adenylate kinase family enzyme